jgi:hypothetical protein
MNWLALIRKFCQIKREIHMIGWMIIACEIGFWLFVIAGLFTRYILKQRGLGTLLLFCTPLIDFVLIVATVIDIQNGAAVNIFHGLAAFYIAVTVVYGHGMIRWADERYAYHFAGGPKPFKRKLYGMSHAKFEQKGWLKHLLAWGIGNLILLGMILFIGNKEQTLVLTNITRVWTTVLVIDFLVSFSYVIWPRKEPAEVNKES